MTNTLHKSLTIASLAVSILISGFTVDLAGTQNTAVDTSENPGLRGSAAEPELRFGRLTTEDGLSGDQAYHVTKDSYGFM